MFTSMFLIIVSTLLLIYIGIMAIIGYGIFSLTRAIISKIKSLFKNKQN